MGVHSEEVALVDERDVVLVAVVVRLHVMVAVLTEVQVVVEHVVFVRLGQREMSRLTIGRTVEKVVDAPALLVPSGLEVRTPACSASLAAVWCSILRWKPMT